MSAPTVDGDGPVTAPPARRFPVVLVGALASVIAVVAVLAVLRFWPGEATRVETYPDHVLAAGGSGKQAWTVVANAQRYNDDPPIGCAELRDANGVHGAAGCGYSPMDPSTHTMSYLVGELPGDHGQAWFGPAPAAAVTVELRFPGEPPRRVATVAVDGLPGRFFVLVHRVLGALDDPASFPSIVVTDAAGRPVVI